MGFAAPQNRLDGGNTESRIVSPLTVIEDSMETKKTSGGVVNYINVAPNNGLSGGFKIKTSMNNDDMMEGSGNEEISGSMYQPFETSNNILRRTTTTTVRTTPRTTTSTNRPQPVTQNPNIQVFARGSVVRNDFGTHIVLGK